MANMLRRLTSLRRIRMGMFKQVSGSNYCNGQLMFDFDPANWMGALTNPNLSLAKLTIPGTHDSMTSTCSSMRRWSVCQSMSLPDQLNIGIRYLDLRCRQYKNNLSIFHGPISANQTLRECMEEMKKFLQNHKRECLLIRVKNEPYFKNFRFVTDPSKIFCNLFTNDLIEYKDYFWPSDTIPTVREAAGKIVILRDFVLEPGTMPKGLPYDHITIEDNFKQWYYLDRYYLTEENLKKAVRFNARLEPGFFLTHSSGVIAYIRSPQWSASKINPLLYDYIINNEGRFGIIVMDFPGPELIKNIINKNSFN